MNPASEEYLLAETVFSPYVCNICKKFGDDNKTCQSCKLVSYCSVEHQRQHWYCHRKVCKAIATVLKKFKVKSIFDVALNERNWQARRSLAMCLTESVLKEPLDPLVRQLFLFPSACFECKSPQIDKALICKQCVSIAYCSVEHEFKNKEKHLDLCNEFKLCFEISCSMTKKDYNSNLNLKTLNNVTHPFPQTMIDLISLLKLDYSDRKIAEVITSEMLTCVASLIYIIEKGSILDRVNDELNITIVGSEAITGLESYLVKNAHFIPSIYPNLKRIVLTFVGPTNNKPIMQSEPSKDVLDNSIIINYRSQLYHDFILSSDFNQPDIICAFNSGFHVKDNSEFDAWTKTIPRLHESKYLTAFTSYNKEEAVKDFEKFITLKPKDKCIKVICSAERNPFRSYRPHRDWENDGIFYHNNYISLIETQEVDTMLSI